MSLSRRAFFGSIAGAVTFGYMAKSANAGTSLGVNAPPQGFPEFNWIDFPEPIQGIAPIRGDHLVTTCEGIYKLYGCREPFQIAQTNRGKARLWIMHLEDWRNVRVELWHKL